MRIVTTTSVFPPEYPQEAALYRLAALGFDTLDIALDYCTGPGASFIGHDYLAWAKELRARAERIGVSYTHSHSPGESRIERSLEVAAVLGAKYSVLHPRFHREDGQEIQDPEEFIDANLRVIRPLLAKAEECGVVILSENLLWGASIDPVNIAALVEAVDSEWFGWCFDTGHANAFGIRPERLRDCAVPPLSLHMQDNHGDMRDEHLIPGDGNIDWQRLIAMLNEVGYRGDCVLEAHHQSIEAPDTERDAILLRLLSKAKELQKMMQS